MKYVKTFEAYITYDKMGGGWGTPSQIEDELRTQIINLFIYGGISDKLEDVIYTDQSTDKGIKWQIEVKGKNTDIIHAYKDGKWRGQYEWYLNKKRSSKADIQQYFLDKYISVLDQYMTALASFDFYYHMADDSRSYKAGQAQADNLVQLYTKLSAADKKRAHDQYTKINKTSTEFKQFRGA